MPVRPQTTAGLGVAINPATLNELRALAAENETTISTIVRSFIRAGIAEHRRRRTPLSSPSQVTGVAGTALTRSKLGGLDEFAQALR